MTLLPMLWSRYRSTSAHSDTIKVSKLKDTVKKYLDDNGCGERLRNGVSIAIIGHPDVGKSR